MAILPTAAAATAVQGHAIHLPSVKFTKMHTVPCPIPDSNLKILTIDKVMTLAIGFCI